MPRPTAKYDGAEELAERLAELGASAETVAKAGIAVGVDGIFLETHPNPAVAKSDGANMLKLEYLEKLLTKLVAIRKAVNSIN